jgi:hypothetical protein
MDTNKNPNRRWTQINADKKQLRGSDNERERSPAFEGRVNAVSGAGGFFSAIRRAVLLTFPAMTAMTAMTALITGCASSSGGSSGSAAGGQGRPAYTSVQNDRFVVTTVDLSAVLLDNQKYARWTFGLRLKQPLQLRSIRVEDVSEGTPVLLVNDQAPQPAGSAWTGYTGAIEPTASSIPWLFDNAPAKRTFRFTVTDLNGQDSVLEQTVTYPVKTKKELIKWYGFSA